MCLNPNAMTFGYVHGIPVYRHRIPEVGNYYKTVDNQIIVDDIDIDITGKTPVATWSLVRLASATRPPRVIHTDTFQHRFGTHPRWARCLPGGDMFHGKP